MSHRHILSAITAAFVLAIPSAALAQDGAEKFLAKRFQQLDKDGDGLLSAEEAKPVELWVKGADANKDGMLSLDEVTGRLRDQIAEAIATRRGASGPDPESPKLDEKPAPFYAPTDSPREAAARLKPGECGIGTRIPDATLTDLDGKTRRLTELTGKCPAVIALISSSCPVSKRYAPSLARLEAEYRAKGVAFILLAPTATDSAEDLRTMCKAAGITTPCLRGPQSALLKTLGATASTDTFVVDAALTLVYRGAIDDQYGLGYSLDAPRERYLAAALDAVLDGRAPQIAATQAPGCALDLGEAKALAGDITYHNRISRLVQANCQECHRAGGVAPFALETYEQVTAKSGMIRKMIERGLMPPWFAAAPEPGAHSPWSNDRSLGAHDKADLLAWLSAGKPAGDAADAPLPRSFPAEWAIGTPDAIVQIPDALEVQAEGTMPYKNVTVETNFGGDKWVRGFEVQPTAREVVHHVLIFAQEPGAAQPGGRARFSGEGDERDGFFAAWVPGGGHVVYPDGFAKPLPAGAKLRFQIHYTPNGTATRDQVRLGLLFAKEAPRHIVRVAGIADHRLSIPPGVERHPETAVLPVPADVKVLALMPHMHVRGAAFRFEAILPDGAVRTLLDVPRYDFNWQLAYRYAEPRTLPRGSKVRATGWFDNSANNPANPDPAKTVRWGPQTSDEMMLGYVEYYVPSEQPLAKTAAR
jgi:peroxiredoxin